jgi:predicted nuclease of predicted toxin-antitoxin system
MRLLANENFPRVAVEALRQNGHDVLWARLDMPGDDDVAILSRAQTDQRLILTFDKDFGELAFRWGLPATSGVILVRFANDLPDVIAERIVALLQTRTDWAGYFSVVESHRIRTRPLPRSADE